MTGRDLLLLTNLRHDDGAEDRWLAERLSEDFDMTVGDIAEVVPLALLHRRCLVRNAWPSREAVDPLTVLAMYHHQRIARVYNPPHRGGYVEDKRYLHDLHLLGRPVIPTMLDAAQVAAHRHDGGWVVKPLDGCSSFGVEFVDRSALTADRMAGHLAQPAVAFVEEVSLYFLDGTPLYAMRAPPGDRWALASFRPSADDLAWAAGFVEWNAMPYGLQRIDGCRLPDGSLLLMEIEDQTPYLSLLDLSAHECERVCVALAASITRALF